jgi:hypothetical protein
VDLPGKYNVYATLNVSDLSPFDAGDDSRSNPFEEGGIRDTMVELRRSRKQCKHWCNPLGPSLQIYRARP